MALEIFKEWPIRIGLSTGNLPVLRSYLFCLDQKINGKENMAMFRLHSLKLKNW